MHQISRREFVALAGAAASSFALDGRRARAAAAMTAQDVIDRIKAAVGVDWKADTVDTIKAGDPAAVVRGIVTTAMATMDVLTKTVAAGANLVITCEPTFYARADTPVPAARRGGPGAGPAAASPPDPVFAAKQDFIKTHNLVVWRFSDHWRLRKPDPLALGLADALGWSRSGAADDPARVSIPAMSLAALASDVKTKLRIRGGMRVVGDPQLNVQRIGLLPGTTPIQAALKMLPDVDAVLAGEVREWESVEYARDKVTAGEKRSLILIGRVVSEDPGMNACSQWLKTIVPEVTARWIAAGDPYWRPR
jgi:putative NIF3 family GTP cyclohydrolase 1 type 2